MESNKEIANKINKLLKDNPLAAPAVVVAEYDYKHYTDQDWKEYQKETGNPIFIKPATTPFEMLIDKSTGLKKGNDIALLKFLLWYIEGFIQGMEEGNDQ